ncbi:MAG: restriction endonuclease [Oscillibacter sp.]|nr:restriction endonuclease [Oscillibacter sp.]
MNNKKATRLWAVHSLGDAFSTDGGAISFDWPAMGDLSDLSPDKEAFRQKFDAAYPDGNAASRAAVAGALYRLVHEAEAGDYVACLHGDTVSLGTIGGAYEFRGGAHRRPVNWIKHIPQSAFSRDAMREITCSPVRLFAVKRFAGEFLSQIGVAWEEPEPERPAPARPDAAAESVPAAALIRPGAPAPASARPATASTRTESASAAPACALRAADYAGTDAAKIVLDALRLLSREGFRQFAAGLLRAMGYAISLPPDGGLSEFEMTARRDELFPPVWVSVRTGELTESDVARLNAALTPGARGLAVTSRELSERARRSLKEAPYLRAVGGAELAALTLKYYCGLDERYRAAIPLRLAFVPTA